VQAHHRLHRPRSPLVAGEELRRLLEPPLPHA
jgi:hypothetical protein